MTRGTFKLVGHAPNMCGNNPDEGMSKNDPFAMI